MYIYINSHEWIHQDISNISHHITHRRKRWRRRSCGSSSRRWASRSRSRAATACTCDIVGRLIGWVGWAHPEGNATRVQDPDTTEIPHRLVDLPPNPKSPSPSLPPQPPIPHTPTHAPQHHTITQVGRRRDVQPGPAREPLRAVHCRQGKGGVGSGRVGRSASPDGRATVTYNPHIPSAHHKTNTQARLTRSTLRLNIGSVQISTGRFADSDRYASPRVGWAVCIYMCVCIYMRVRVCVGVCARVVHRRVHAK